VTVSAFGLKASIRAILPLLWILHTHLLIRCLVWPCYYVGPDHSAAILMGKTFQERHIAGNLVSRFSASLIIRWQHHEWRATQRPADTQRRRWSTSVPSDCHQKTTAWRPSREPLRKGIHCNSDSATFSFNPLSRTRRSSEHGIPGPNTSRDLGAAAHGTVGDAVTEQQHESKFTSFYRVDDETDFRATYSDEGQACTDVRDSSDNTGNSTARMQHELRYTQAAHM
jgi:hypothetical protein